MKATKTLTTMPAAVTGCKTRLQIAGCCFWRMVYPLSVNCRSSPRVVRIIQKEDIRTLWLEGAKVCSQSFVARIHPELSAECPLTLICERCQSEVSTTNRVVHRGRLQVGRLVAFLPPPLALHWRSRSLSGLLWRRETPRIVKAAPYEGTSVFVTDDGS